MRNKIKIGLVFCIVAIVDLSPRLAAFQRLRLLTELSSSWSQDVLLNTYTEQINVNSSAKQPSAPKQTDFFLSVSLHFPDKF